MILDSPALPVIALVSGFGAALVWGAVLVRSVAAYRRGVEHRPSWVIMAFGAFLTAIGTMASALGYAISRGTVPLVIDPDVLSLIASFGRGALLASGLIVLAHYQPPR